jgi:CheY-like chemotaxis protein
MGQEAQQARILIIDDREGIRDVFQRFLGVLGLSADTAADGEEGLRMLGRQKYALVISDLKMPGMSGIDVAEAVRQFSPETGVLIVSGSAVPDDLDRIRRLGVPYLPKPVMLNDFTRAVDDALRSARRGDRAEVPHIVRF